MDAGNRTLEDESSKVIVEGTSRLLGPPMESTIQTREACSKESMNAQRISTREYDTLKVVASIQIGNRTITIAHRFIVAPFLMEVGGLLS